MRDDDQPLAVHAGVTVRLLADRADLDDALGVLDRAEDEAGAPLVDEAERRRLEAAVADDGTLHEHHHAVLADRAGGCVGYAGLVLPEGETHAVGDVALPRGQARCADVLQALLHAVDEVARRHDAHGTEMWIRQAAPDDVVAAVAAGYAVQRRLAVLGRPLHDLGVAAPPVDTTSIRPSTPADTAAVVAVLDAAYSDTADGGWDEERFAGVAEREWFRHEDLLVAEDDEGLAGLHWTKRRGDGAGEVFNLAVHPRAQGRRLGRRLLDAGLAHLAEVGCDDVVLWVDLANEAAVRLYVTAGFTARWEDVALLRHTRADGRHHHR